MMDAATTVQQKLTMKQTLAEVLALGAAFWIPVLVYFLDGASYFGILNVLNVHLGATMGLSDAGTGFRTASLSAGLTLAGVFLGGVVDRWGPRKAIAASLAVGIIGRAFIASADGSTISNALVWFGIVLTAISVGTLFPAIGASAKNAVYGSTVTGIAFSLLYALSNGGQVAEGLASPSVRARWGTSGVIWMCTGIAALALLVHLLLYPRKKATVLPTDPADTRSLGDADKRAHRHPLRDARFLFFVFALLGVRTLMAHQWLTVPEYVLRAYSEDVGAHFEWFSSLNPLICLIGTPLVAFLTGRVHVVKMMIIGTLVTVGSTFILVPGPAVGSLLAYQLLFAIGECLWSSRFIEYVAEIAPKDKVGLYQGLSQLPWFIAKFTTGFYSGTLLTVFCPKDGYQRTGTLWAIYGAIALTSPIALIIAQRWLKAGKLGASTPVSVADESTPRVEVTG